MKGIIFLLFTLLTSCFLSTWDTRLILINNTNETIRYHYQVMNKSDFILNTTYCDKTTLYQAIPDEETIIQSSSKWDFLLKKDNDKILRIYIINEDSLSIHGLCDVFINEVFEKRYDLTYNDLEDVNWKVVYDE